MNTETITETERPVISESEAYWQRALKGFNAQTVMIAERKVLHQGDEKAGHEKQQILLSKEITVALQELGEKHHLSLSTLVLGACAVLVSRYSGEPEVLLGVALPGHTVGAVKAESATRQFIKALPMRVEVEARMTPVDWLKKLQEQHDEMRRHANHPLAQIQAWGGVSPELPLFENLLVFENFTENVALWQLAENSMIEQDSSLELLSCPLGLLVKHCEALVLEINYDSARFQANTIERMLGHLQTLMEAIATGSQQRVSDLPLSTQAEREQLLLEWNETKREYPSDQCMHELFEEQVALTPEAVALVFEKEQLTYRELNERANRLAHRLRQLGVGPEVLVGVLMERSPEMMVALFGVLKAGGAYVPLDPQYPHERLQLMLQDIDGPVLLTQRRLLKDLPEHRAGVICLDSGNEELASLSVENPGRAAAPENLAYLIYTSGSTGEPKGVMIQHRGLVNYLCWCVEAYGVEQGMGAPVHSSFGFDLSITSMFAPLMVGQRVVLTPEEKGIEGLSAALRSGDNFSLVKITPAHLEALTQWLPVEELAGQVRALIIGGEALLGESLALWQTHAPQTRLINEYGPTETVVGCCVYEVPDNRPLNGAVPIGRPIANTQIYILDSSLNPVAVGVIGELYIGGDGLARGYRHWPELTAEKFIPHPLAAEPGARLYRTGDLARFLPDGNIDFLGRNDHQVKIRGFRIELEEIEAVLARYPAVRTSVVVAREDAPGEKRLAAYIVPRPNVQNLTVKGLRTYLSEKLPDYMIPAAFVMLEELPLTSNGKLDRRALPLPARTRPEMEESFVAARTQVEEVLAGVWSEVLGVERVGMHDDFFLLGGHSLSASMVAVRLRSLLQVEVSLRYFFECPTVAEMAQRIEFLSHPSESLEKKSKIDGAAKYIAELSPEERSTLVMRLKKKTADQTGYQQIPRRPESDSFPLSFAQQRLWFLDQLEPNSPFYNVLATFSLKGRLNVDALEHSLNEIIRRHEALRTNFTAIDGHPVQIIAPHLSLPVPVFDLSKLTDGERAMEVSRRRRESQRPFNLAQGPLVRASVLRLGEGEHILLLTMHHIVSDGWSLGVLIREMATLYEALATGQTPRLAELPIQYADFAVWQRQWLSGEVLEQQLRYWKQQLGGALPILELPTDRPRPAVQTYRGSRQTCEIGKQLTEALKELSRLEGATLYMTLLAAFETLLYRYTGQEEIIVGTPIANRNWMEIESLIGFFVNTLVLRTAFSAQHSFRDLLARVREVTLEAYAHQDLPFEKLVEELQPDRDMSRSPLFQVMFSLQNAPMPSLQLQGLTISLLDDELDTAQFDLTLDIVERPDGLACVLEYNTDLFDEATVRRLLGHFQQLLQAVVADPRQSLATVSLLTEQERRKILSQWNDTRRPYPHEACIHELFEEQAARTPEAIALVCGEQALTYDELNRRANQLAHHLRQLGVGPEMRVGILLERSLEIAISLLGVLKAGGAYLALDPVYPPERLRFMLEDGGVTLLLTQERLCSAVTGEEVRLLCLDTDEPLITAHDAQNLTRVAVAENLAYLVYTSGTTGRPKGILVPHRALINTALAFRKHHEVQPSDRILQFASLSFDVAAEEFFASWLSGARAVMWPEQVVGTHEQFVGLLECAGVTLVNLPASFWLEWLRALEVGCSHLPESLRLVVVGNEKTLPEALARWRRMVGERVHWSNAYGPTETTVTASNYEPSGEAAGHGWTSSVPIGRPVMNAQLYVLDQEQEIVPVGVIGELYIGGAGVARGYHRQAEQTAERFVPHPFSEEAGARLYRTGDLVRYLSDGNVEFVARADEQVKIRGYRIELAEVEAVLAQHAGVREVAVVAREEPERGAQRLVAYVVVGGADKAAAVAGELRRYMKERLPEYMVPAAFVLIPELPLTPNGKVDRRALPEPDELRAEREEVYIAPRSEIERTIAAVWQEMLKVEKVGVHDNFFGLGGHSLLMVNVNSKLREALKSDLSMIAMFKFPTVSALAEHLSQKQIEPPTLQQNKALAENRIEAMNRQRQLRQRRQAKRL